MTVLAGTLYKFNSDVQESGRLPQEHVFDVNLPDGQTTSDTTADTLWTIPAGFIVTSIRVFVVVKNTGGTTTCTLAVGGTTVVPTWVCDTEGELAKELTAAGAALFVLSTGLASASALTLSTAQASATATVGAKVRVCVSGFRPAQP